MMHDGDEDEDTADAWMIQEDGWKLVFARMRMRKRGG